MVIHRHSTAIQRYGLSRPVSLALDYGLLASGASFFDYGCGRGDDVAKLSQQGVTAFGWDPHYRPDALRVAASVVNLGYVLNVIEDPLERVSTLRQAYELAERCLVVSVRVDQSLEGATPFGDGVVTGRQSFQKIFTQAEFRDYIVDSLGMRPFMAGLGIAFVFKNQDDERQLIGNQAITRGESPRDDAIAAFKADVAAREFIAMSTELGRLPVEGEFSRFGCLKERFGSMARILRLANALLQSEDLLVVRERRREDLLLFIAMTKLQGLTPPPYRMLPKETRADIKMLWPSYQATIAEGERFLFQIGDPKLVRAACVGSGAGKVLPDALYFHRSAEALQQVLVRLIVFAARQVVGEVEHDLVKVKMDGRGVSFLKYQDFENDPHPALEYSFKVSLPLAIHGFRDYRGSLNPPIIHRKEAFLDPLHPRYAEYRALTEREEELGLLSRNDIGFKQQWIALLESTGPAPTA